MDQAMQAQIRHVIQVADRYKYAYAWAPSTATDTERRAEEFVREYVFTIGDDVFAVKQSLSITPQNYYFASELIRNGCKSNLQPLKTALALANRTWAVPA